MGQRQRVEVAFPSLQQEPARTLALQPPWSDDAADMMQMEQVKMRYMQQPAVVTSRQHMQHMQQTVAVVASRPQ